MVKKLLSIFSLFNSDSNVDKCIEFKPPEVRNYSMELACKNRLDRTGNSLEEVFQTVGLQKVEKHYSSQLVDNTYFAFPTSVQSIFQMRSFGVISTCLEQLNGGHEGVDISGEMKEPVMAVEPGEVVYVLDSCENYGSKWCGNGWGNHVVIKHENGLYTRYAHLDMTLVEVGEKVYKSQKIGLLGSSGLSNGPHLHLEAGFKEDGFINNCITPQNFDFVIDPKSFYLPKKKFFMDREDDDSY